MQKITFRKLIGENYIYPELQGHFIEFLGSCIYDGIWVGEDSEIPNYHCLLYTSPSPRDCS